MIRTNCFRWVFGLLTVVGLASFGDPQEPAPGDKKDPPILQNPIEVQTRGPVHEAFAQPFDVKPEPGTVIPKQPPPPVREEPPAQRPDDPNAAWVPGYWAWDAEKADYMWITGGYRIPPQGRTFVPGYWSQAADGWRWIAGFWTGQNQQELAYTPEPPATLDSGPQTAPPNEDALYIPGTWIWQGDRFVWRPGYYAPAQLGRVWIPPHYVWTPNGYLFVDGYYDLPMDQRGLAFAPVYFNTPLWNTPGWSYRPNYALNYGAFFDSAFLLAGSPQFYFGNYYGSRYAGLGYRPWYTGRGRYDPLFAYYGWQNHRNNPNWIGGVQQTYANRASGRAVAPPRTFAQQGALVRANGMQAVVTPLNQFKSHQVNLVRATPAQLATQKAAIQRTHELTLNRQRLDAKAVSQGNAIQHTQGRTLRVPTMQTRMPVSTTHLTNIPRTNSVPLNTTVQSMPRSVTPQTRVMPQTVTPQTRVIPSSHAPQVHYTQPRTVAPAHVNHAAPVHRGGGGGARPSGGHRR